jgi:hypothetical protein
VDPKKTELRIGRSLLARPPIPVEFCPKKIVPTQGIPFGPIKHMGGHQSVNMLADI